MLRQRDRVVGAVVQPEVRERAQAAPVPAVIERDRAIAGRGQRFVLVEPVEVRGRGPAVEQQQRRPVAARVAHEELTAARDFRFVARLIHVTRSLVADMAIDPSS